MDESLAKLRKLLETANSISINKHPSKNYFEVSGYPHYENVCSSILAFFFDTNEEHGLKDLWLKSLIECYKFKSNEDSYNSVYSLNSYETVENGITREESTPDMKRLDIVIPTNNDFVVAIENKVFADAYNPFDKYSEWIDRQYSQYSDRLKIVLSLKPVSDTNRLIGINRHGNPYCFINITYKELLATVQKNIGSYLSEANEKWLIYMNEFIKNIDSLQEGSIMLNKDWQIFIEENNELINEFNRKIQSDNKSKIDLVKKLANVLQERISSESNSISTQVYTYGHQSFAPHISLVIDIKKNDNTTIALEPYFKKAGSNLEDYQHLGIFYITVWVRQKASRETELELLEDIFRKNEMPFVNRYYKDWGNCLELNQFDYSKDVNEKDVEAYILDVWKALVSA